MNPKEKAKELVESYEMYAYSNTSHNSELFYKILRQNAKQCAIICVDEIIKANPIVPLEFMLESEALDAAREYWQQIKKEIELL